ncbi:hypothetical protein L3Q82_010525, partial [Scortum barcoo]
KSTVWVWLKGAGGEETEQVGDVELVSPKSWAGGRDSHKMCDQMALGTQGQWRKAQCAGQYLFLCEKEVTESLLSVDSYLTGLVLMTGVYAPTQIHPIPNVPDTGQLTVEMQLFPGMWFSHAGQLASVKLVVQPASVSSLARVQILRPYCNPNHHLVPPGCNSLLNPFTCCSAVPLCNTTGGCSMGQYWCHLLEACVHTTNPCSPYDPRVGGRGFALPPRYPAILPFYHLVADLPLRINPSSELKTISVLLPDQVIMVYPDDIVAIQHTRDSGTFLHCLKSEASLNSPWRQSYLSLRGTEWGGWWEGGLTSLPQDSQWVDGVVCDLRMLYVDNIHRGTEHDDNFDFTEREITTTPDMEGLTTGPTPSVRSKFGLNVIHPMPDQKNQIHVQINVPTLIVVKVLFGEKARSSWSAPVLQTGVPFLPSCPREVAQSCSGSTRQSPDAWFSSVTLLLPSVGVHMLNISVMDTVSSQSVSVRVFGYEAVTGLSVEPHGCLRILIDTPQSFIANVESGSSVKFTWVIDNLEKFAHEGESYSIVFKKPAEYHLKVTASNPVSTQSKQILLTADEMTPLAEPEFLLVREVVAVDASHLYTLKVKVDISLPVTFRWDFGDGSSEMIHVQSAPCQTIKRLIEKEEKQVYIQDSVNYTYFIPDDYTLRVQVSNQYDKIDTSMKIGLRPQLNHLFISSSLPVPLVKQILLLEAFAEPSTYTVMYTWDFGDGSEAVQALHPKVSHIFVSAGVYNITVCANNTLTVLTSWLIVEVMEKISGLTVSCNGPSELSSSTDFKATVATDLSLDTNQPYAVVGEETVISALSNAISSTNYYWTVDGLTSTRQGTYQFRFAFLKPGVYEVKVIAQNLNSTVSHFVKQPNGSNDSRFTVLSTQLHLGAVYIFTLTVQKAGRKPASVNHTVTVCEDPILPVVVECVSCSFLSSPYHTSYTTSIILSGQCGQCDDQAQYKWSAEDQTGMILDLNEVATATSPNLVLGPGVLRQWQSYIFTLNVSQPDRGQWGSASLTILPNNPPHSGMCDLSPESDVRSLETVVTYNCSGWQDDESRPSQLIYTFQVAPCQPTGTLCPVLTLYRGTRSTFGSLVPMGSPGQDSSISFITVRLLVENHLGAKVIALNRVLTMKNPAMDKDANQRLRNKSQTELWALVQHGNPQEIIPYSIALTSQLNQMESGQTAKELMDRREIRENVTQALASLPVSSLLDVDQISSALSQSTAVPGELVCESCHKKVLEAVGKMINVMEEHMNPGVLSAVETGRNILNIIGSTLAAVSHSVSASRSHPAYSSTLQSASKIALSALGHAGALMRSLMHSRVHGEAPLLLSTPFINTVGFHGDPSDLLCTHQSNQPNQSQITPSQSLSIDESKSSHQCQFHIPTSLTAHLKRQKSKVVQVLFGMDAELGLNPLLTSATPPISTTVVAMELTTPQGQPIPIQDLDPEQAIRVTLPNKHPVGQNDGVGDWRLGDAGNGTCLSVTLPTEGGLNLTVRPVDGLDENAGLYISFYFSLGKGATPVNLGHVKIEVSSAVRRTNASQDSLVREWALTLSAPTTSTEETIFLSPLLNRTDEPLSVNLTSSLVGGGPVHVSVCVFSSLCQYYSVEERRWSSEGLQPLEGSTLHAAHCLTQHLTMFGASLFVHPGAVVLLPPPGGPMRNMVVGIVCAVLVLIHLLVGLIAHKLDHVDSLRLSQIPLSGRPGLYHHRVLVKTGWRRGSGLDPSWYVQHVVVWDPHTDHMFFFLLEDWLSVENHKNGTVEKEVLASLGQAVNSLEPLSLSSLGPEELSQFWRVFISQLMFGMVEHHLWLSLWERPAHSRFTRGQRVTCSALMLHLYLALGALWYGAVGTDRRVQVPVDMSVPPSPVCQSVEMDVFLGQSGLYGPSILSLPDSSGPIRDSPSSLLESKAFHSSILDFWAASGLAPQTDGACQEEGIETWLSCDSLLNLPVSPCLTNTTPDPNLFKASPALGPIRQLRRKKGLMQLRLASTGSPSALLSPLSQDISSPQQFSAALDQKGSAMKTNLVQAHKHNLTTLLTLSEEDLLTSIAAAAEDTADITNNSDSGRDSPATSSSLSNTRSISCSSWSEQTEDKSLYGAEIHQPGPQPCPSLYGAGLYNICDICCSPSRGVARGQPSWLLPPWVLCVIYPVVAVLLAACLAVVGLYGSFFSRTVVLMWLVSALSAFLTSALLLEPLKVCVQALICTALWRPVDPEVEDQLAQEATVVRPFGEHGGKVRPPCGYGLLQAKEEARKVRALRSLMRHCVCQLLFLLLVLMVNYQDSVEQRQGRLLHSTVKRHLHTAPLGVPNLTSLLDWSDAEQWISYTLVPHLHQNSALRLVGLPRLQYTCALSPLASVFLGDSNVTTQQVLADLHMTDWSQKQFKTLSIDFTHYHRESALFVCVSLQLEWDQTQRVTPSLSIHPLLIPSSFSGLDLQAALTVLLLISAILILSGELWSMASERAQILCQCRHWFQLLLALLSLATAILQLCFFSQASSCVSKLRSQPHKFINFGRAALLAQSCSQCAAVLLTLLVLKLLGTLRFVRRWVVLGRVLQRAWKELWALSVLLLLLLLLCSHLGNTLFSRSVEGFLSVRQTGVSVLSILRGRMALQRLCRVHPVLGPLYGLLLMGGGVWFLARLCGAVLIHTYRVEQAELYHPTIEPQDYEMVEFFIKRLKLWMGLTKAKEFRHRVKFEDMDVPPSRSSQESRHSTLSSNMPSFHSPSLLSSFSSPRPMSSALSMRSEDSSVSESGFDVQPHIDRLLPCVNALLSRFDQVSQITEDIHNLEMKLEEAQTRRRKKWITNKDKGGERFGKSAKPKELEKEGREIGEVRQRKMGLLSPKSRISLPSSFTFTPSIFHCSAASISVFPRKRSTHSESESVPFRPQASSDSQTSEAAKLASGICCSYPSGSPGFGLPRRRAWHSGSSHSADAAQRIFLTQGGNGGENFAFTNTRPRSEEGVRRHISAGVPVKRKAWISEGSETEQD